MEANMERREEWGEFLGELLPPKRGRHLVRHWFPPEIGDRSTALGGEGFLGQDVTSALVEDGVSRDKILKNF